MCAKLGSYRSRRKRLRIFHRDQNTCLYCERVFEPLDLTLDHIIPASRGGTNLDTNLATSCNPCQNRKGDRSVAVMGLTFAHAVRLSPAFLAWKMQVRGLTDEQVAERAKTVKVSGRDARIGAR